MINNLFTRFGPNTFLLFYNLLEKITFVDRKRYDLKKKKNKTLHQNMFFLFFKKYCEIKIQNLYIDTHKLYLINKKNSNKLFSFFLFRLDVSK